MYAADAAAVFGHGIRFIACRVMRENSGRAAGKARPSASIETIARLRRAAGHLPGLASLGSSMISTQPFLSSVQSGNVRFAPAQEL